MDEDVLEYSVHAREGMSSEFISEDDVEGTVLWPTKRRWSFGRRIEHFGYAYDGRLINVVTDRSERIVITVIDVNKRRRARQTERRRKQR